MSSPRPLEVLVVDDSAVVRQAMVQVLPASEGFKVTVAGDPIIALDKMARSRPDVIVLDLDMPRMDGISFLRKVMAEDPIPVVICSALTTNGAAVALRALDEGAVDVIAKPRIGVREFLQESSIAMMDAVRAAATARLETPRGGAQRRARAVLGPSPFPPGRIGVASPRIIAIGASTGGTEALRGILETMTPDVPGIVIVQHMPEVFTAQFARHVDRTCRIEVKEAVHGDRVERGRAIIAAGNRHCEVRRRGDHYVVDVTEGPLVSRHRPSVDVLFRSVARAAGAHAIGVILTGMGDDGADGLTEMRNAGARTLAQDEASCVVFGMPKEAIRRGGVDEIATLPRIAAVLLGEGKGVASAASPGR